MFESENGIQEDEHKRLIRIRCNSCISYCMLHTCTLLFTFHKIPHTHTLIQCTFWCTFDNVYLCWFQVTWDHSVPESSREFPAGQLVTGHRSQTCEDLCLNNYKLSWNESLLRTLKVYYLLLLANRLAVVVFLYWNDTLKVDQLMLE